MRQITLPSGMTGNVRGLSLGKLHAMMKDKANAAKDPRHWMAPILGNVWLETTDHGIYPGENFDWADAMLADRFTAILFAAAETYGPDFPISVRCPAQQCGKPFQWDIDLTALEIVPFPEEVLEKLRRGENDFTTTVRDRVLHFVVPTGRTESALIDSLKSKTKGEVLPPGPLDLVLCRVKSIDGMSAEECRAFVGDLELWEVEKLQADLDAVDGGPKVVVEVQCPHCEEVAHVQLPFDPTLFQPRKGTRRLLVALEQR